jgi:hypothetical protein
MLWEEKRRQKKERRKKHETGDIILNRQGVATVVRIS